MTTIERTAIIEAPKAEVWAALADFGAISVWNPNVKASKLTSTKTHGIDITRECHLSPMGSVQERVIEWIEGEMMSIEVYQFDKIPAMRSAVATLRVEPVADATRVTVSMEYAVGLGSLGVGMNALMMKRQFGTVASKLVAGLKLFVETGQPVPPRAKLPLSAVSG